ncbi:MAG TPA: hypothetical protein VGH56_08375 [Solirubrobacteraceae bacterium]
MKTRELVRARVALDEGEFTTAFWLLREAGRVAVAQRKLDELLEVRELTQSLSAQAAGRTRPAAERLAESLNEELRAFPAEALTAAGIPIERQRTLAEGLQDLAARANPHGLSKTRDLTRAEAALAAGELRSALWLLGEARRVAVAQKRPGELVSVYELVQTLRAQSNGKTQAASEKLAARLETDINALATET